MTLAAPDRDDTVAIDINLHSDTPATVPSGMLDAEQGMHAEDRHVTGMEGPFGRDHSDMKEEPCCAGRLRRTRAATPLSALGVASTVAALFAPKCPLCIAGYLTLCGLGAGWAGAVAPVVRPAAFAISFMAFTTLVVAAVRRWRSANVDAGNE